MLMSAAVFAVFVKGRIARPVEDLDDDTLKAIAEAAVPDWHAALDEIIVTETNDFLWPGPRSSANLRRHGPRPLPLRYVAAKLFTHLRNRIIRAQERKSLSRVPRTE